jgi:hypothetical protein
MFFLKKKNKNIKYGSFIKICSRQFVPEKNLQNLQQVTLLQFVLQKLGRGEKKYVHDSARGVVIQKGSGTSETLHLKNVWYCDC